MNELKAEKRNILGSKVRKLRNEGIVPAELYGHGVENVHLSIPTGQFEKVYKDAGERSVITIDIEGKKTSVLIRGVQVNPTTDEVLSADLYQIKMDEKVKAKVPVEFVGASLAVDELGGVLVKSVEELEVEAFPMDIPNEITVDISSLKEFDQSIYVKDLSKSDKFVFEVDPETAIVSVSAPREEEVEEPTEEITPEDVIVEGEKKRDDEEDSPEDSKGGSTNEEKG